MLMFYDAREKKILCCECAEAKAGADLSHEEAQVTHQLAACDPALSLDERTNCADCGATAQEVQEKLQLAAQTVRIATCDVCGGFAVITALADKSTRQQIARMRNQEICTCPITMFTLDDAEEVEIPATG